MLESLATVKSVGILAVVTANLLARTPIVYRENTFAEPALWKMPLPVAGSSRGFRYRVAYLVDGVCVVRYDNEAGKGDHRHFGASESDYSLTTPEALLTAFEQGIVRWNLENSDS